MKDRVIIIVKYILFTWMIFLSANSVYAQIDKPDLGSLNKICDSPYVSGNFTGSFSFTATFFQPGNQFIVQLSDASGNFNNNPTDVNASVTFVTASTADFFFRLPKGTYGENYKLRIKSTSPSATSPNSIAFPAYYKIQNSTFSINNFNANATYCPGGSYVLTIDNPGTGSNDSPLKYPSLTYNWFKETDVNPIATGSSLTVTQPGTYYVETNYGSCSPTNSHSNKVTVSEYTSSAVPAITSSLGNPFCSSAGSTILSSTVVAGNSYQWYKDNVKIEGAIADTYQTDQAGLYAVVVNLGSCVTNASIDLQNDQFISSINVSNTNMIAPEETLAVVVTTTASIPEYKWYLDGSVIPGAVGSTYNVTIPGNYKVVITQTSGCIVSNEILFVVNAFPDVVKIPNLISPNGDGINDTWILPREYVSGTNTTVVLISSSGEIVFQTNDYQNNWPEKSTDFKNVNPVYYYIITTQDQKVKKGSITIVK